MSEAILRLSAAGGDELKRILGNVQSTYRGVARTIANEQRSASRAQAAEERRAARQSEAIQRQILKVREQIERDKTRATLRETARQNRAQSDQVKEFTRAQRTATAVLDAEAKKHTRIAEQEAKRAERITAAMVEMRRRAEQKATDDTERFERRRTAIRERAAQRAAAEARRNGSQWGSRIANGIAGGVSSFASQIHGEAQGARERRADSTHTLNSAFYQAGARGADFDVLNARVYRFAREQRMDSGEVAGAINATQTEFSTIGDSRSTQAERSARLEQLLSTMALARDTGQNIGEVARVSALLQNSGITGAANRATLLGLTGMAQRGAIELGSVSREAMMPMTQRMHDARGRLLARNPHATEGEIANEEQGAALSSFAEIEVARGQGAAPRRFARVMAQLGTELQGNHRQQMLLGNINSATGITSDQRQQLRSMFDHGELRAQFQSGLGFASRVNEVLGGNESAMRNMFAGGGHGNPMGMQTNWRDAVAQMMSGGADVQRMIHGVGTDFTEDDVSRGHDRFFNEDKSMLTGQREEHDSALTDNTSAIVNLSNQFANWSNSNPMGSAALSAAGGAVGTGVIGKIGGRIGGGIATSLAGSGVGLGTTVGAAGLGTSLGAGALALGVGLGTGELINRAIPDRHSGLANGSQDSIFSAASWHIVGAAIADAFRENPPTVVMGPMDAAHAASVAATRPPAR